jgi:molybdate transport system permease protein
MTPERRRRRATAERLPWPAGVLAALAVAVFALPFIGLLWRVPWSRLGHVVTEATVRDALALSLRTSLLSTSITVVLGVPLAWALARIDFPGRRLVRALATLSMVLPPVVGGVALFASFGRRGLFGRLLDDWFGIRIPFTTGAVVLAQTFVAMPFLVLTVEAALRQFDHRMADAARTLGAGRWTVFSRVTLPAIRPALIAGAVLAWARALGEFGATITFAGNLPGSTQTMPLAVYLALERDPEEALLISLVLIGISLTVLLGLRDRWLGEPPAVDR